MPTSPTKRRNDSKKEDDAGFIAHNRKTTVLGVPPRTYSNGNVRSSPPRSGSSGSHSGMVRLRRKKLRNARGQRARHSAGPNMFKIALMAGSFLIFFLWRLASLMSMLEDDHSMTMSTRSVNSTSNARHPFWESLQTRRRNAFARLASMRNPTSTGDSQNKNGQFSLQEAQAAVERIDVPIENAKKKFNGFHDPPQDQQKAHDAGADLANHLRTESHAAQLDPRGAGKAIQEVVNPAHFRPHPVIIEQDRERQETTHSQHEQPLPRQEAVVDPHEAHVSKQHYITPNASESKLVDMRQLAYELPFDNPDGGKWKQGWDVQPRSPVDEQHPLHIFVLPHSHCDPGWIKTFDQYFQTQTKSIITTVVNALSKDPKRKFIWAEISYFQWWWNDQTGPAGEEQRDKVRQLLKNGQLEFVTGGWVQPDEANSELYAMEIQLQEGHDWINATLGEQYIPQYSWSIDPFGYSPTMAYLLKKYGFKAMLIQRVHYAVKKELAKRKHLEFMWRQVWDDESGGEHDIFTHVMPFYSYDAPHSCGPDPAVCCQFDFARYPVTKTNRKMTCPWRIPPSAISDDNVKERSMLLLDQYLKKANLYRGNAVLVPLGDDFRYQTAEEAENQYTNYHRIFDYLNANVPGVRVQFGTLSDYFKKVMGDPENGLPASFEPPLLKGSFFTYSDVNQDYWSGYFTSRVFDKALDRQLERVLYAATQMGATKDDMQEPRRALSLFQHHDGVTGTAKDQVVEDYAKRMHEAIAYTQDWLVTRMKALDPHLVQPTEEIKACWQSDGPREIKQNLCGDDGAVIAYNPLDTPQTCGDITIPSKTFQVASLPCETPGGRTDPAATATPRIKFDPTTGLMVEPFREEWMVWKVSKGGAYLFVPGQLVPYDLKGQGVQVGLGGYVISTNNWKRTVLERKVPAEFGTTATVIDFIFETDLRTDNEEWIVRFNSDVKNEGVFHTGNAVVPLYSFVMLSSRETAKLNRDLSYTLVFVLSTDLNGFNFDTHLFRSDMPIQSQVFPMPTLASIQDASKRLTVLSEHAQGTASLKDGAIDLWLDRRLRQDDARGLGQGVKDNRRTRSRLRLVLEPDGYDSKKEFNVTGLGRRMWDELQHPLEVFGHLQEHARPPSLPQPLSNRVGAEHPLSNLAQAAQHNMLRGHQSNAMPDAIEVPKPAAGLKEPRIITNATIDMRMLNSQLKFDNPDGGSWKQGWDVQPVDLDDAHPLKIFVLPHSHCDPGWIKTFDEYFRSQTTNILTTVVNALAKDPRRKFIWAEISYFQWWWNDQGQEKRDLARRLLASKQLEFVTGGWVQPDEANSELYAMETQLQEGHDWINQTLGPEFIPSYGWSIDPFGYSPTMAWLLKKYGFKAMLIQRVHYAVKKELAKRKHLEFYWRQTWDKTGEHDIFTHVMPFYSYDVPHTCGPDPSVCCQFDFRRFPVGDGMYCPWGKKPQAITDANVRDRSLLLLDQYRKKADLYRGNVVLIPLGDDFRYQTDKEAENQYNNYQKMFDWINKNVAGAEIQFGTLSEYFEAVMGTFEPPLLKGSFFTYSDVNEDYWSGYFTSRVFDKALDRELERVIYAAMEMGATKAELQEARRALSLFQHHDGVTGTAKNHVVEDYAKRMFAAISSTQAWMIEKMKVDDPALGDKFQNFQACWQSGAPRDMKNNLCDEGSAIAIYNPLVTPQTCGDVVVQGHTVQVATLPCETPGKKSYSSSAELVFDPSTGMLVEPIREEWMVWRVNKGGAYLFVPGQLVPYDLKGNNLRIQRDGYVVETNFWKRTIVEKTIPTDEFGTTATVLDFIFETELKEDNQEWIVRFSSDIKNAGVFHTDLNGFDFDTHYFRSDMPIQSQVFPMPTLASIEDEKSRFTVLSEHAQGTASLKDGSIDLWLDRRLRQDDARGLGQGIRDNRPTRSRMRLILERDGRSASDEFDITPLGRRMWDELQHPLEIFGHVEHRAVEAVPPIQNPNLTRPKRIVKDTGMVDTPGVAHAHIKVHR